MRRPLLALALLGLPCTQATAQQQADGSAQALNKTSGVEQRNSRELTVDDAAIFNTVIDYLDTAEYTDNLCGSGIRQSRMLVIDDTTDKGRIAFFVYGLPQWAVGDVGEAAKDLIPRNREGNVSLKELKFCNPNAILGDIRNACPNARGFVTLRLPGYSRDGQTAVIRFLSSSIAHRILSPPRHHLLPTTCVLTKEGGQWTIKKHIWSMPGL